MTDRRGEQSPHLRAFCRQSRCLRQCRSRPFHRLPNHSAWLRSRLCRTPLTGRLYSVIAGCGCERGESLWLGVLFSFLGHRFLLTMSKANPFEVECSLWQHISWAVRWHFPCAACADTRFGDGAAHRRKLSRLQPHELVGGPRRDMGNPVVVACSLASLVALYAIRGRLGSRIGAVHLNPRTLRLLLFFL